MFIALQVNTTLFLAGLHDRFVDFRDNEEGQGMVEYGLILALVALAAIIALTGLGAAVAKKFTDITSSLGGGSSSSTGG